MDENKGAAELAMIWIDCWNKGTPDSIPLAGDFKHTSPFGCVEGREKYLEWVKPLAAKNVTDLRIQRVLADKNEAAIHFEMKTQNGWVDVCDWVFVKNGKITEIQSFYDASGLRDSE